MLPEVHSGNVVPPHGEVGGWQGPVSVRHNWKSNLGAKDLQMLVVGLGVSSCAGECAQWRLWTDGDACHQNTPGQGYHQLKNVLHRVHSSVLTASCLSAV